MKLVKTSINFNTSTTVQVFETTIRIIGGLLSAHIYAESPKLGHKIKDYDGFLLDLAHDLGERLLDAFSSPSGIPYPRINLRYGISGVPEDIQAETCTAGAGSVVLEFTLLSRLTGDNRFENVAKRAFYTLWNNRSPLDLLPMSVSPESGEWLASMTGIGASIDSYYEYALKMGVLFHDKDMMNIFKSLYKSLKTHSLHDWLYRNVDSFTGVQLSYWVDSLSAFFPGVQVLFGEVEEAARAHLVHYKLWNTYGGIPERWMFKRKNVKYNNILDDLDEVVLEWYPLRPELIESTYYLYQSTKDPFYLQVGKKVMEDIHELYMTPCGFSGIQDIRTGGLSDRMESFVLSETFKYLYLLFDVDNDLNKMDSNFVLSTEAHPFWYDKSVIPYYSLNSTTILSPPISVTTAISTDNNVYNERTKDELHLTEMDKSLTSTFKQLLQFFKHILVDFDFFGTIQTESGETTDLYLTSRRHLHKRRDNFNQYTNKTMGNYIDISTLNEEIQCPVLKKSSSLYSRISSWSEFYYLDKRYKFTTPEYLKAIRPQNYMDLESTYYDTFVNPQAMCSASVDNEEFEVLFGAVEHTKHARLESVGNDGNNYYTQNLSGLRIQLERIPIDRSSSNRRKYGKLESVLVAHIVNGVRINENLYIEGKSMERIQTDNAIGILNGMISIHDEPIINLLVRFRIKAINGDDVFINY